MKEIHSTFQSVFGDVPQVVSSAPGRVEVLGNHTDYNGGTVVGACIDRRLSVALKRRTDDVIRLRRSDGHEPVDTTVAEYSSSDLPRWSAYPLGVFDEFRMLKRDLKGFDLLISSELPTGEGLSSSAAFELASALALQAVSDIHLPMQGLVGLSHRAENRFLGVPCGLLDQTVVGFGRKNHFVVLDASTGRHHVFNVPEGLQIFLFRTHIRHELTHSPYETRHRECRNATIALSKVIPGIRHLAHLHPVDIEAYDVITDETLVRRARHVTQEQRRVGQFLKALHDGDAGAAGQLLTDSHTSSKTLFENSTPEMDFLVDRLTQTPHVLGARLSGAGWGGAVLALVNEHFSESDAQGVSESYFETFDAQPGWWKTEIGDGASIDFLHLDSQ